MDPVTIAKLWLAIRPIKRIKERREAKRKARQGLPAETREVGSMAINTGLRSSSNSAIAAVIVNVVVGVVNGLFPDFTIPADWLVYLTAGSMWLVGRFTKTPEAPKVI